MLTLTPSDGHSPAVITAHGPVGLSDIKETMRLVAHSDCGSGVIWDMREAELGSFHCRDIKDLVETISVVLPKEDVYRVAIIGNDALHFGFYRAFQTYAEFAGLKRDYGYFVDLLTANEWVTARQNLKNSGLPWPAKEFTALSA